MRMRTYDLSEGNLHYHGDWLARLETWSQAAVVILLYQIS